MLQYPHIDPVAFHLGPIHVHWYGLMYLFGFIAAYLLALYRGKRQKRPWTTQQVADLIFYLALGVIIGGRTGYMLFYDWEGLIARPLSYFAIWDGGMSFHGGLIGVILAMMGYAHYIKRRFWEVGDFVAPLVPIGLGLGRLGNFINGELWGRASDLPWSMVFPTGGPLPRHPSQLYEFLLEGVILFIILWLFSSKLRPRGAVSGLFLLVYGVFRFLVEFVREPDPQLGFVAWQWMTRGQELCIPMIIAGLVLLIFAYKRAKTHE